MYGTRQSKYPRDQDGYGRRRRRRRRGRRTQRGRGIFGNLIRTGVNLLKPVGRSAFSAAKRAAKSYARKQAPRILSALPGLISSPKTAGKKLARDMARSAFSDTSKAVSSFVNRRRSRGRRTRRR